MDAKATSAFSSASSTAVSERSASVSTYGPGSKEGKSKSQKLRGVWNKKAQKSKDGSWSSKTVEDPKRFTDFDTRLVLPVTSRESESGQSSTASTTNFLDLSRNWDFILSKQVEDREVVHWFRTLSTSIGCWWRMFKHPAPEAIQSSMPGLEKRLLRVICGLKDLKDLPIFLKDPSFCGQFAKGWTYLILYERILDIHDRFVNRSTDTVSSDFWMGETVSNAMLAIENALIKETYDVSHVHLEPHSSTLLQPVDHLTKRQFHAWRSYTTSVISRSCLARDAQNSPWYREQIQETQNQVLSFLDPWIPDSDKVSAHATLKKIIESAVSFSKTLRQQRAYWTVQLPLPENPQDQLLFNPATMQDSSLRDAADGDDDSDDSADGYGLEKSQTSLRNYPVELVISPALFKRGDASGQKYDIETCFVKAEVRCKKMTGEEADHTGS